MWSRWSQALMSTLLMACSPVALSATSPADPAKIIHMAFEAPDEGFDLGHVTNAYSVWIGEAIFEPLLTYDYMARPAKLVPLTAEAMPEISDAGKTYTFHIKKGIYFAPDAVFKGTPHELTAADYIYSFKRLIDPANRSQAANFLEGKIVGLDELGTKAKKSGHFDYDAPLQGLQALDRYTLRIQLNKPDYNFLYAIAYAGLGAVAREVIEPYGAKTAQHPVGTGPYMLEQYVPNSKIVLTANPDYRGYTWNFQSSGDAWDEQMVRDMKGKKMPQVGRIEVSIIEEEQSRWLAFEGKQLDLDKLPQSAAPKVLDGDKLNAKYAGQNIRLNSLIVPEVIYTNFNMRDPIIGGYNIEKIALRRAVALAYSDKDEIIQARRGLAVKAEMMVPVGVIGHVEHYRSSISYDMALANQLLDRFGYKRGANGFRSMPDGKPLVLKIANQPDATSKIYTEIWKRGLDQIGVHAEFSISSFADNHKAAIECKLMMWDSSWQADFPDGENFLKLLTTASIGQGNHGCYQSTRYDALYAQALALPSGAERNKLYLEMNQLLEADTAVATHTSRIRSWLVRPWVKGFKRHPIMNSDWQYLDVEKH